MICSTRHVSVRRAIQVLDEVIGLFPPAVRDGPCRLDYNRCRVLLRTIIPLIAEHGLEKGIDVGAGPGVISMVLRRLGFILYAVDTWREYNPAFENQMGQAQEIIERLTDAGIACAICDIERQALPFEDESFDFALFLSVLEHLKNSPKVPLAEIRRVLKRGGYLILNTPNIASLKKRLYLLLGKSPFLDLNYLFNSTEYFGHMREYTCSEVRQMLEWSGYELVSLEVHNCTVMLTETPRSNYVKDLALRILRHCSVKAYLLATAPFPYMKQTIFAVARRL